MAICDRVSTTRMYPVVVALFVGIFLPPIVAQIDDHQYCGLSFTSDEIRDGISDPGSWPWQVSIEDREGLHLCSGTIIDKSWIVTAANCLYSSLTSDVRVAVGINDISQVDDYFIRSISQVIYHPNYDHHSYRSGYDLALLQLTKPLTINPDIAPVCVTPGYGVPSTTCYTTGWNKTLEYDLTSSNKLLQAKTSILDWFGCRDAIGPSANLYIQVCAKREQQNAAACNVEVGSPLVCKRQGSDKYDLWGVASWNMECQKGSVYNLFITLKTWISNVMINNTNILTTKGITVEPSTSRGTTLPTRGSTRYTTRPVPSAAATTESPTQENEDQCGIRFLSRIVGGDAAHQHSWPWMVSLQNRTGHHFCGGTIIAREWILTAAHCLYGRETSSIQVEVGVHNIRTHDGLFSDVEGFYIHRGFVPYPDLLEDIALIKLLRPLTYNYRVQPVCLPSEYRQPTGTCYTTGWGYTNDAGPLSDNLRQLVTPVQNGSTCSQFGYYRERSANRLCSGTRNSSTCFGDSGGPLMCPKAERYEIVGITSFGYSTCTSFTVNTRVISYSSWIRHQMNVQCGRRFVSRIVGGERAPPHSWPWMVSLQFRGGRYFCSGVIIAPKWILTAGHCVSGIDKSDIQIKLGVHNLRRDPGQVVDVAEIHLHPDYILYRLGHDIALVKLAVIIAYDFEIHPVCLPSDSGQSSGSCFTTGWGFTAPGGSVADDLQQVVSPVQNDTTCSQSLRHLYQSSHMICAGTKTTGTCNGDSGGPLVCPLRGRYQVWGITSFGSGSCQSYTGYTRVTYYLPWIRSLIT